jgi:hypothetical protein
MNQGEEPGKQKTRSCRAQELARSRARENVRKEKIKYRTQRFRCEERPRGNLWTGASFREPGSFPESRYWFRARRQTGAVAIISHTRTSGPQ